MLSASDGKKPKRCERPLCIPRERLSTLHAATREIAQISQDPEQVYASIHQAASRLLPTEAFTITLVDGEKDQI